MKKVFLLAVVLLGATWARAVEPVSVIPWLPESTYTISQSTVSISSTTISWDSAVSGYRAVYLSNITGATTIYYRIDGTTTNVAAIGWPILPGQEGKIESNGLIGYQLSSGTVSALDVRKKVIRK